MTWYDLSDRVIQVSNSVYSSSASNCRRFEGCDLALISRYLGVPDVL